MAEEDSAEKSFEATPHKLEQARKKGEIPKSTDLTAAATYLGLMLSVAVFASSSIGELAAVLANLIEMADRLSRNNFAAIGPSLSGGVIFQTFNAILVLLGASIILILLALTVQRSWVFAPEKLNFKISRISVISGLKNKFGANGLFEFLKSVLKLILVTVFLILFSINHLDVFIESTTYSVEQIWLELVQIIVEFLLLVLIMSIAIGGADYLWQVTTHLKKNRMSRKEIEDETKSNDGDPNHKQKRRQRGVEIAMNQMLADVPKADVILVNPTHYAVALQWSRSSAGAPICVAKGVDNVAAKIREIAESSQIPIYSDPPTARAVFATVDVGMQIVPEHYKAVAVAIRFAEAMRTKAAL